MSKDIFEASMLGNLEEISFFLSKGIQLNSKNVLGYTPLMLACQYGHHSIIKDLVLLGADLNIKNNDGNTAAMLAVLKLKVITPTPPPAPPAPPAPLQPTLPLLEIPDDIPSPSTSSSEDKTQFETTSTTRINDFFQVIRILIECGADLTIENNTGKNVVDIMHTIIESNDVDALVLEFAQEIIAQASATETIVNHELIASDTIAITELNLKEDQIDIGINLDLLAEKGIAESNVASIEFLVSQGFDFTHKIQSIYLSDQLTNDQKIANINFLQQTLQGSLGDIVTMTQQFLEDLREAPIDLSLNSATATESYFDFELTTRECMGSFNDS